MRALLIIVAVVIMVSCSSQRNLQKSYVGKPLSSLESELGKPQAVFNKDSGDIYIFEKIELLKSTEISQHKLTLDPMVTPKVKKTSRFTVTVVDEVIKKIEVEEQYDRNN
ncbi:hypothetical protein [uncultured Draconibacterium sp.]|uniref:hypothetical protein n=1 Tax=uncultured Draconibacterium sp. TaxID=1573823 RepID=UPI0029C82B6F|nr:hypothetical protein [uncultured Draconibacterium sp.]